MMTWNELMELCTIEEVEAAAEWCAVRGFDGKTGGPLPENLSCRAADYIDADPVWFHERVRDYKYARAMSKIPGLNE